MGVVFCLNKVYIDSIQTALLVIWKSTICSNA